MRVEEPNLEEALGILNRQILSYRPEDYVRTVVLSVRDIYDDRSALKALRADDAAVSHVAGVIVENIEAGRRMRTLECLRVLKSLTKSTAADELSSGTVEKLFRVYQEYVFWPNEDVQWAVSAMLKDRVLSDSAVDWLVSNAELSEHIVNRLLYYPVSHPAVVSWAEQALESSLSTNRASQVISVLITPETMGHFLIGTDAETLAWAIYRSRMTTPDKVGCLKELCFLQCFWSLVEIAERLRTPQLLEHFAHELRRHITDGDLKRCEAKSSEH